MLTVVDDEDGHGIHTTPSSLLALTSHSRSHALGWVQEVRRPIGRRCGTVGHMTHRGRSPAPRCDQARHLISSNTLRTAPILDPAGLGWRLSLHRRELGARYGATDGAMSPARLCITYGYYYSFARRNDQKVWSRAFCPRSLSERYCRHRFRDSRSIMPAWLGCPGLARLSRLG